MCKQCFAMSYGWLCANGCPTYSLIGYKKATQVTTSNHHMLLLKFSARSRLSREMAPERV